MVTLSEVRDWDTAHLTAAATQWTDVAAAWESAFTAVYREAQRPAGIVWVGRAAEAAQARAHRDRLKVLGLADALHEVAAMARSGASELESARRRVLSLLNAAQQAGVDAPVIAADLRSAVAELAALDRDIATRIASRAAVFDDVTFAETSLGGASPAEMFKTGGQSDWSIKCTPSPFGGWDCTFRVGNGWWTEHFWVRP